MKKVNKTTLFGGLYKTLPFFYQETVRTMLSQMYEKSHMKKMLINDNPITVKTVSYFYNKAVLVSIKKEMETKEDTYYKLAKKLYDQSNSKAGQEKAKDIISDILNYLSKIFKRKSGSSQLFPFLYKRYKYVVDGIKPLNALPYKIYDIKELFDALGEDDQDMLIDLVINLTKASIDPDHFWSENDYEDDYTCGDEGGYN